MTLQLFPRRPKPFADRLVDIAVVMFIVAFAGRIAWSLAHV